MSMNEKYSATVLYVEDEAMVREPFVEMLTRRVKKVITATNGQEGLELYHQQKPDLVITDIKMPVMDGLTMAAFIRGDNPYIPIIITTAFEFKDYLKKSIDVGINKYLVKPIERQAVDNALADLIKVAEFHKANREHHELLEVFLDLHSRMIILADVSKVQQVHPDFLQFFGFTGRNDFNERYPSVLSFFSAHAKSRFTYNPEIDPPWIDSFLKLNGIENNTFLNFSHDSRNPVFSVRFFLLKDGKRIAIILESLEQQNTI